MSGVPSKGCPAALAGAMMKDKKPFTYTPGGLDLSEIRSPRMQRRLIRNASCEGVKVSPLAQSPSSHDPANSPVLPPGCAVQVLPMPGMNMKPSNYNSNSNAAAAPQPPKEIVKPKPQRAVCGPAPPPPPFMVQDPNSPIIMSPASPPSYPSVSSPPPVQQTSTVTDEFTEGTQIPAPPPPPKPINNIRKNSLIGINPVVAPAIENLQSAIIEPVPGPSTAPYNGYPQNIMSSKDNIVSPPLPNGSLNEAPFSPNFISDTNGFNYEPSQNIISTNSNNFTTGPVQNNINQINVQEPPVREKTPRLSRRQSLMDQIDSIEFSPQMQEIISETSARICSSQSLTNESSEASNENDQVEQTEPGINAPAMVKPLKKRSSMMENAGNLVLPQNVAVSMESLKRDSLEIDESSFNGNTSTEEPKPIFYTETQPLSTPPHSQTFNPIMQPSTSQQILNDQSIQHNSIHQNTVLASPPIAYVQQAPSMAFPQKPPMTVEQTPPMVNQQTPPMAVQQTPPMAVQQPPPMAVQQTPPMAVQQTPPMAVPQTPPMAVPQTPPMAVPQTPPMAVPQTPPMAVPQTPPMAVPQTPPMAAPQTPPMAAPQTPPMAVPQTPKPASQIPSNHVGNNFRSQPAKTLPTSQLVNASNVDLEEESYTGNKISLDDPIPAKLTEETPFGRALASKESTPLRQISYKEFTPSRQIRSGSITSSQEILNSMATFSSQSLSQQISNSGSNPTINASARQPSLERRLSFGSDSYLNNNIQFNQNVTESNILQQDSISSVDVENENYQTVSSEYQPTIVKPQLVSPQNTVKEVPVQKLNNKDQVSAIVDSFNMITVDDKQSTLHNEKKTAVQLAVMEEDMMNKQYKSDTHVLNSDVEDLTAVSSSLYAAPQVKEFKPPTNVGTGQILPKIQPTMADSQTQEYKQPIKIAVKQVKEPVQQFNQSNNYGVSQLQESKQINSHTVSQQPEYKQPNPSSIVYQAPPVIKPIAVQKQIPDSYKPIEQVIYPIKPVQQKTIEPVPAFMHGPNKSTDPVPLPQQFKPVDEYIPMRQVSVKEPTPVRQIFTKEATPSRLAGEVGPHVGSCPTSFGYVQPIPKKRMASPPPSYEQKKATTSTLTRQSSIPYSKPTIQSQESVSSEENVSSTTGLNKAPLPWMNSQRRESSAPPEFMQPAQRLLQSQPRQLKQSQQNVIHQQKQTNQINTQHQNNMTINQHNIPNFQTQKSVPVVTNTQQETKNYNNQVQQRSQIQQTSQHMEQKVKTSTKAKERIIPITMETEASSTGFSSSQNISNGERFIPISVDTSYQTQKVQTANKQQQSQQNFQNHSAPHAFQPSMPISAPISLNQPNMNMFATPFQNTNINNMRHSGGMFMNQPEPPTGNALDALQQMQQNLAQLNSGLQNAFPRVIQQKMTDKMTSRSPDSPTGNKITGDANGAPVQSRSFRVLQNVLDTSDPTEGADPSELEEYAAPEPKKYMGGNIPSRSFKMLQAFTDESDVAGPGETDL